MARASVRPTASFSTGSKKQANNKDRRESGCQEASKPTSKDKKASRKQAEHKQKPLTGYNAGSSSIMSVDPSRKSSI
jgi:hypothetical protein